MSRRFLFRGLSIQQRLPLLICILLLFIIISFSWISYFNVKKVTLETGRQRLHSLTGQLSTMLGQSVQTNLAVINITAGQQPIRNYLLLDRTDTAALGLLHKLRSDNNWVMAELLDSNRVPLLRSVGAKANIAPSLDSVLAIREKDRRHASVGKISLIQDSMYYPMSVPVTDKNKVIGYLVRWRLLFASAKSIAQFSQLIGTDASLYIGNTDGSLWTDMMKPISVPALDTSNGQNFFEYSSVAHDRVIAAAHPIPNTSWVVLVEFSRATIIQGATHFLKLTISIGIALIIIGILVAWRMSRNITSPLNKLTVATAAIAHGDYSLSVEDDRQDELGKLARSFNAMTAQVDSARQDLEKKVLARTSQLETANKELEAFSYSVSHDLRAPLRAINGHAKILKEDYGTKLDDEANRLMSKIVSNARIMGQLIDDLILFSKMGSKEIMNIKIDMKSLAESCISELLQQDPQKEYKVKIHSLPAAYGDQNLVRQVWMNLISNALKYSSKQATPYIEIGYEEGDSMYTYFVKDNGVGFDMQYANKLFGVFQRLHSAKLFEGNGIGLAFAKRIIVKHGGEIWADAVPDQGATFYFSLPKQNQI